MEEILMQCFKSRRSVRSYTGEPIPEEKLNKLLTVGLLSESGHNARPWELIVVTNPEHLQRLTNCKVGSGKMLQKAGAAIVVAADPAKTDLWLCDGAIQIANMHLMAEALGLGSCYINALNRKAVPGGDVETFLKQDLGIPEQLRVVGLLSVGIPAGKPAPHTEKDADWSKVHRERFSD